MSTSPIRWSTLRILVVAASYRWTPTGAECGDNPLFPVARRGKAVAVDTATDLVLAGALAAIWLSAGLLVEALPTARTARGLRRRTALISALAGAGAAMFVAVPLVAGVVPGASAAPAAALLPAVPGLVVLTVTLHRLTGIRRGTAAFATAPLTPTPPTLRAAAAHPLVSVPLQVTGLAAVVALPVAAGVVQVP